MGPEGTGTQPWLGLGGVRYPRDGSPQSQKQMLGTHWEPACWDAASRGGGSQRGRQPQEQPGLCAKLAPASSLAGNQYGAPALRTQQAAACPCGKGGDAPGCSVTTTHLP